MIVRDQLRILLACVFLLVAYPAGAQRSDVVVLDNGNAITGEIKSLQQGKLKFKTDNIGTIYCEWDHVQSLSSSNLFEVENQNGVFHYGMLIATTEGKTLAILESEDTIILDMEDVVAIMPIKKTFLERIDGSLNVGFSFTSADNILQYSLESDATYRKRKYMASIRLSSIQTRQEGKDDIIRDSLGFSYTRDFGKRYFGRGSLDFSRNSELGIALRTQLGYSFGRNVIQTNRTRLSWNTGFAISSETPIGEEATEKNLSAVLGAKYHFFLYNFPKTDILIEFSILPGITDWPRNRVDINASLRREIIKDFTLNFSFYDSYDSDPPAEATSNHDYGAIFSIGWTF